MLPAVGVLTIEHLALGFRLHELLEVHMQRFRDPAVLVPTFHDHVEVSENECVTIIMDR